MADIKALYHSALDTITPVLMDHDVVIDVGYFVALLLILGASQKLGYRLLSATGLQHKVVRYLLLPGVFLHELAHFVVAVLSGFRRVTLTLLPNSPNAMGHVNFQYVPNLFSYGGMVFTAIAPLPVGLAALFALLSVNNIDTAVMIHTPEIWHATAFINYLSNPIASGILQLPWYQGVLLVYLYAVIALTMIPSRQDLKVALFPVLIFALLIATILFALSFFKIAIGPFLHWLLIAANHWLQVCVCASLIGLGFLIAIRGIFAIMSLVNLRFRPQNQTAKNLM